MVTTPLVEVTCSGTCNKLCNVSALWFLPPTSFKFTLGFNRIQAYDQKDMSRSFFSEEINPLARFGFKSHRFFKFEFLEKYEKKLETISSLMLSNVFQTLIIYIVKI
jgi:hypothetical protein